MRLMYQYVLNVLQFVDYDFFIHYDETTRGNLDRTLSNYSSKVLRTINYKIGNVGDLHRPAGYKYAHIVYMADPFLFEAFSKNNNLKNKDVVLFVMDRLNPNVWNQSGLERCGCVFLYDVEKFDVYYVHFFVGKKTGVLNKISVDGKAHRLLDYVNNFNDFNGHSFKVGYYPHAPYIWCSKSNGERCEIEGIDGKLLLLLSHYLNFKFHATPNSLRPGDAWRIVLEDVHSMVTDWGVGGLAASPERSKMVDFTSMLHKDSFSAVYAISERPTEKWNNVFLPLQPPIWGCLVVVILSIGAVVKIASTLFGSDVINRSDHFRIPFLPLLEQSFPMFRVQICSLKILLSVWLLTSIILTTAYKSKLASTTVMPTTLEPNSLLELYDEGYDFQVNIDGWSMLKEKLSNSDERYQRILERCSDDLRFCESLQKALSDKVALIDGELLLVLNVHKCDGLTAENLQRFRKINQNFFHEIVAWAFQKGAPFRDKFSESIQTLFEAGIIEHWYKSYVTKSITISHSDGYSTDYTTSMTLTISTCLGAIIVLLLGHFVSLAVFVYEIVYFRFVSVK